MALCDGKCGVASWLSGIFVKCLSFWRADADLSGCPRGIAAVDYPIYHDHCSGCFKANGGDWRDHGVGGDHDLWHCPISQQGGWHYGHYFGGDYRLFYRQLFDCRCSWHALDAKRDQLLWRVDFGQCGFVWAVSGMVPSNDFDAHV